MRKYVKPVLFYEHYELSQHIADCAWELQLGSENSCEAIPDPDLLPYDFNLLLESGVCTVDKSVTEDYCYQPGAGEKVKLFQS